MAVSEYDLFRAYRQAVIIPVKPSAACAFNFHLHVSLLLAQEVAHVSFRDFVHQQQFLHWQFGKRSAQASLEGAQPQQKQLNPSESAASSTGPMRWS